MSKQKPNRLVNEQSPYLLQHAYNPVDWYPWGEEAFSIARSSNKPIFLSIGYSTCHWCHVMERESFKDQEIAKLMNENFTNIKVDREERPDVDNEYMSFVVATRGSGGWPLSVFLSPHTLKPFFGGTYFPPRDSYGIPSFRFILSSISKKWSESSTELIESSDRLFDALNDAFTLKNHHKHSDLSLSERITTLCDRLYESMKSSFDNEYGGFSNTPGPKFPTPVQLFFLLSYAYRYSKQDAWNMVKQTLDNIINGGIHDHVDGGFHRYSIDRYWHVPHFEKMLYDQSQLLSILLEAFQYSKDEYYAITMRKLVNYVLNCLVDNDKTSTTFGLFHSAEDADSRDLITGQDKEGAYYTWTKDQIEKILETDSEKFFCHFELHPDGVLYRLKQGEDQFLESCLERLGKERKKRPKCHKDKKFIISWNAMMIKSLAQACIIDQEWIKISKHAMDKLIKLAITRTNNGSPMLSHMVNSSLSGFSMDYAHMIDALLTLYRMTFDGQYYILASQLQTTMNELFYYSYENDRCGYSMTIIKNESNSSSNHFSIFSKMATIQDGAEPNTNSVALGNLITLFYLNQDIKQDLCMITDDKYIASLIHEDASNAPLLLRNAMVLSDDGKNFNSSNSTILIYPLKYDKNLLIQMNRMIHKNYLPFCIIAGMNESLLTDNGTAKSYDLLLSQYPNLLISSIPTNSDTISQKDMNISICQMNKGCLAPIYSIEDLEKFLKE